MDKAERVLEVVPYGLKVADDHIHLEREPREHEVMMLTLELIVQDYGLSKVAEELNARGYLTRRGNPWNAANVFELLPRLIEAGPKIFTSAEWVRRRRSVFASIQQ
jgi:hypothetical protein